MDGEKNRIISQYHKISEYNKDPKSVKSKGGAGGVGNGHI